MESLLVAFVAPAGPATPTLQLHPKAGRALPSQTRRAAGDSGAVLLGAVLGALGALGGHRQRIAARAAGGGASTAVNRRFLGLGPLLVATAAMLQRPALAAPPASAKEDEVVDVVDGDTVKLAGYGRCRLIGVNTPETVAPRQRQFGEPPDCYGPEASALTKSLLPKGTKVKVELDVGPADKYGRELIYLYRAQDGLFVNAELVKQGAARHMKVAPNVKYDDLFVQLEKEASTGGRGLWKSCSRGGPSPALPALDAPGSGSNPGNLKNCKDFKSYDEAVKWFNSYYPLYGDVANLDGDKDGKPCESLRKKK